MSDDDLPLCWLCSRPVAPGTGADGFCAECTEHSVVFDGDRNFLSPDLHECFRECATRMGQGGPRARLATLAAAISWAAQIGARRPRNVP